MNGTGGIVLIGNFWPTFLLFGTVGERILYLESTIPFRIVLSFSSYLQDVYERIVWRLVQRSNHPYVVS